MKNSNLAKLRKILKQANGDPDKALIQWKQKEAKFLQSLNHYSKNELISLLCKYFIESEFHAALSSLKGEYITEQGRFIKKLKQLYQESNIDCRVIGKEALKAIKDRNKHIDYLQNIKEQREASLDQVVRGKKLILERGRDIANKNRKEKSSELEEKMEHSIRDLLATYPEHRNKQIVAFLSERGFLGDEGYSQKTLEKKVATIAGKVRKESTVQ